MLCSHHLVLHLNSLHGSKRDFRLPVAASNFADVLDVSFLEHSQFVGLLAQQELDVVEICALDASILLHQSSCLLLHLVLQRLHSCGKVIN